MSHPHKRDEFVDEIRSKQRNIVFPDTVRNVRNADVFLWRGSPNPKLVQRIGAWLFGSAFIGTGLVIIGTAAGEQDAAGVVVAGLGIVFALIGARVFRNGFPRR